ncbi:MAG: hypothetical protein SGJ09_16200 [Phycisphaerae bacterium]|nr:hypothetical protein [Phycisphaerae bacterium]
MSHTNQLNRAGVVVGALALASLAIAVGQLGVSSPHSTGRAAIGGGGVAASSGPDVVVGALPNVSKYGTVDGISAYALGTTSCNVGDSILLWCDTNVAGLCTKTQHPVIGQNLYRVMSGRVEQIGMSWLKHGFCALSENLCNTCQVDPFGCDALGIGCSDPYDSSLNGSQGGLGPRSQVNASTGIFPYPFTAPAAPATIGRRMQVPIADLVPADNPGALYFGEGHYVTADDAAANNDNNNASYRRMTVGALTSGSYTLAFTGSTVQQTAGIYAWKAHGLGLNTPDPSVTNVEIDVAGDGRFVVAYKASDNGNGTWHYEYAVYNMNSDRSGQSFSVPVPDGVVLTNVGQHLVNDHSGEPYSTDPWTFTNSGGVATWSTQTFAENQNAHALRWGTMFNFRFDADQPPVATSGTIALFKSGAAANPTVALLGPDSACAPADINCDGTVDGADLASLLGAWGTSGPGDLNGDGTVDGADLATLLGAWS